MSEEPPDPVGKSDWSDVFGRHHKFLLDHMDPDFGLLDQLISSETLSYEQEEIVKAEKTTNQRNGKLLDIIRSEGKWDGLIFALGSSKQIHLVNYLEADGKHSFDHDWPLMEQEEKILRVNHASLIELIDVRELVVKLFSIGSINKSQLEFIQGEKTSPKQNAAFMKILRRRSIGDYNLTIDCLKETNQLPIARLLEEGGSIVRIHVNTDLDPEEEKDIAIMTQMIIRRPSDKRRRLLNRLNFDVMAAKTGDSVVLYVYLKTKKQLNQLKESLESGVVKNSVELFFNAIMPTSKHATVSSVRIANDEISRVEDFLPVRDSYERRKIKRSHSTDEQDKERKPTSSTCTLLKPPIMQPPQTKRQRTDIDEMDDNKTARTFIQHTKFLDETMHFDSGLLGEVISKDVLATKESRSTSDKQTHKERNANQGGGTTDQEICDSLVDSPQWSEQKHVVTSLVGDKTDSYEWITIKRPHTTELKGPTMQSPEPKRQRMESHLQSTVSHQIIYERDDYVTVETLIRHNKFLEENIDSFSGLIDKLLFKGVLTPGEKRFIENGHTRKTRNAKLLENITNQEKCDSFVDSLRNTRQTHVVNYLINDGIYKQEFGGIWPLTYNQRLTMEINQKALVSVIEVDDEFTGRLQVTAAINQKQKEIIDSKVSPSGKAHAFLENFRRMSQIDFRRTLKCLCDTNQSRVARTLDECGVIIGLQVNWEAGTEPTINIVQEFRRILGERSIRESVLISGLKHLNIIKVKMGQSFLVYYISCKNLNEFNDLQLSLTSGKLEETVDRLFNDFLFGKFYWHLPRKINIKAENEDIMRKFFRFKSTEIESVYAEEDVSQRTEHNKVDTLPLELLDLILQKYYIHSFKRGNSRELLPNKIIITRLASVNFCWFQRLTNRKFKRIIWRMLLEEYRSQQQRHLIIRNSSHYFESSLQTPNQIQNLKFSDCITDVQAARIQRQSQRVLKNKNRKMSVNYAHDLLEIVKTLDESRYSYFIRCLRQTGREKISTTVANGGAAIPLRYWTKTKSKSTDVVEKLNNELKTAEFQETGQLQKTLRELDVELLEACFDRAIVFWIWCRLKKGLEKFQTTEVSKTIITELIKTLDVGFKINVDHETLEKTMVLRSEVASDSPPTDTQLKILHVRQRSLVVFIDMDRLVGRLFAKNVINSWQKELIESKPNMANQNEAFLKILRRLSKKDFALTIECLRKSKQIYAAEILEGIQILSPDSLNRHKNFLEKIVDPDSGLLDELAFTNTLTSQEIESLKNEPTYQKRNAKLLEYMTGQQNCDLFFDLLRITKQNHVCNYLIGNGDYNTVFGGDWPLTDSQMQNLNDNQVSLVDLTDSKALLRTPFFKYGLSSNNRFIELTISQESSFGKNEVFLDIIRRLSQLDFRKVINSLRETHQDHVAEILDKGGVLLRIHVNTDATIEEEDAFVDRLMLDLRNRWTEKCSRFAELRQLKVIAAKTDRDIVFYVYCQKLQEFEHLRMSLKSGQLKDLIEHLFGSLIGRYVNVSRITVNDDIADLRFTELKSSCNSKEGESLPTTLNDLPAEIITLIFYQCYYLSVRNCESKHQKERNIIEKLSAVNSFWLQSLSKRKFRKAISARIAGYFQQLSKRYTVVTNNRQFLMEFVRPSDELIANLESAKYLTKEQVDAIQKLRRDKDKTFDLLRLLKPFDSPKIEIFIRCLRQTKQNRVASIIENGGAVVKTTAKNCAAVTKMIQSINDLLSQRNRNSNTVKIIKDDNNFHQRRKFKAVWIWFQERNAFEVVKALLLPQSINFADYEITLGNRHSVITSYVKDEGRQFENRFVSFSIFAKFTGKLECDQHVRRLTKLKDKIYVGCTTPNIIYTYNFDDRNQFRLQTHIDMEAKHVTDMVSCEKSNCLYVTDTMANCIWKITEEECENQEQTHKITKWLEFKNRFYSNSMCISVTSDGEVLIPHTSNSIVDGILIYGSDTELRLSIPLAVKITELRQMLQTSNGDFIILHTEKKRKYMAIAKESAKLELSQLKEKTFEEKEMHILGGEKWVTMGEKIEEEEAEKMHGIVVAISKFSVSGAMSSCVGRYIPQNEEQILRNVENFVIDSDDRLFVPDYQNPRVILIDPDLVWNRILIPTEEIRRNERNISGAPIRLFYDESNKQLIVAGVDNGKAINVYNLTMK